MNTDHLHRMAELLLISNPSRGINVDSLATVLAALEVTNLADGQPLCRQGDPGDELWVLVKGAIRVHRDEADGTSRDLVTMEPPAMVGHMALVDDKPRSAHCTAKDDTTLLTMNRGLYQTMLHENSHRGTALRRLLLTSLTRQLQGATSRIKQMQGAGADGQSGANELSETARARRTKDLDQIAAVLNGWKAGTGD